MSKRVLSIDIGLQKTKICELEYGKKRPYIYKTITFDNPANTIEDGYIRDKSVFAATMFQHLNEAGIQNKNVIFTISSSKIANREVAIPYVKDNMIQAVVNAGIRDYFPVDISEYVISYTILERIKTKEDKKLKLMLLAAPNNLIKNYYSFAEMMNFTIVALDYIGNSAFQIMKKQVEPGINCTIQISEQTTLINVIDNEMLALQRIIPYGSYTVVDTVLENKILGLDSEVEAMDFLCNQGMVNIDRGKESAYETADMTQEEKDLQIIKGKEEITESMRYLVNNISRVLDYYNTRYPEKKIQAVYISGRGAAINGMQQLFQTELGYEIKQITKLQAVEFANKDISDSILQTEYMCSIGATINPIGFLSADNIGKANKKSSSLSMLFVLLFSVLAAASMIILSITVVNDAKQTKNKLEDNIASLLPVEKVFEENANAERENAVISNIYKQTDNPNEKLNDLITALEEKLPSSMTVTSLTITGSNISINITSDTMLSIAKLLIELREINFISNIFIDSSADTVDENGITTSTFAINCEYILEDTTSEAVQTAQ